MRVSRWPRPYFHLGGHGTLVMIRKLINRLFGRGVWKDVDQDEVERQIQAAHKEREVDYSRADEYSYEHYTDAIDEVKRLKRKERHEEAIELLLWCIEFGEEEARHHEKIGWSSAIAPAYYRHLGIVYRKEDRYEDEVKILERYQEACREMGSSPNEDMVDRLERARELDAS